MKDIQPAHSSLMQFIRRLTTEPGVYRMINEEGTVLYVGKAANLKKRVSSYFNKNQQSAKTQALVNQIARIEVSITRSETEALLLESSFIKSLLPKYNVLMRDDKSYPYIRVSDDKDFPRMELYRSRKKPARGRFFGPYPNVRAVRETLNTIQKLFKIRNCSDSFFNNRSRPCLQYQIKRCTAPCVDYISKEDYQQSVQNAIDFLEGKSGKIIKALEQDMQAASERMAYEEAALLRDQIKNLRVVQEQQGVVRTRGDADVIAINVGRGMACVQCVTIRKGEVTANQAFFPKLPVAEGMGSTAIKLRGPMSRGLSAGSMNLSTSLDPADKPRDVGEENALNLMAEGMGLDDLWQQTLEAFIGHYYFSMPERIPGLIILQKKPEQFESIQEALTQERKKKCLIQYQSRGVKKRWLDFAENNLQKSLAEEHAKSATISARYQALEDFLLMDGQIKRMECFDISHTRGEATVASCVVFDKEGPAKSRYRRFNIKGITPGDDYAAMEQAIRRRYQRLASAGQELPDLLIIDGGKGQLAKAVSVMQELGITSIRLIGVAKGPERKAGWERLILADEQGERTLPEHSPALHLLQHIRDEAHRFAITTHRGQRQKARLESSLESIEGVGSKRRQALLRRFGGIRELSKASIEEIAKVEGISAKLAEKIYQHFR